jgi:hypothetical protein
MQDAASRRVAGPTGLFAPAIAGANTCGPMAAGGVFSVGGSNGRPQYADTLRPILAVVWTRLTAFLFRTRTLSDTGALDRRLRTSPHSLRMNGTVNTARNSFSGCTLFILLSTSLVLPQVQSAPWGVWTCEGDSTTTYQAPTSEAGCCKWTGAWDGSFTTDARQCGSHTGTDCF